MKQIFLNWSFNATALLTLAGTAGLYRLVGGSWKADKKLFLVVAVAIMILCFCSPLHLLSAEYLFSAHMTVHILLLLIVGPLLVMSFDYHRGSAFQTFLVTHPFWGWLAGVGIMWIWHMPFLFNEVMKYSHNSGMTGILTSTLENLSLISAGIAFSIPVIGGYTQKLNAPAGIVYLFTACLGCSLLGLLITFAPAGTYRHFLSYTDSYRLNKLIVNKWNINIAGDQQAAGLIMWVPCCLVYISAAMILLKNWMNSSENKLLKVQQA